MGNYWSGNVMEKIGASTLTFLRQAALLAVGGAFAGGVIAGFGVTRAVPNANTSLTDSNIAANIYAKETTSGCVAAGTSTGCVMVLVGVTNNQFIFTKSGGLVIGPFAAPKIAASGSLLRVGGGWPTAGEELSVVGDMSGSTLTIDALGVAAAGSVPCKKAGGLIGYRTVTATGTLSPTCN